ITAGHARTLVGSDHVDALVADIMNQNLSVRQAEENRRVHQDKMKQKGKLEPIKDPDIAAVEQHLSQILELNTTIQVTRKGGTVKIFFETYEQLDHLVGRLAVKQNQGF
ncbi:MAG: chromosome partitioning protein ParB, partial [Alphaproteobacteria bacterium]|nr:chromosome partitioning protein ParB [Alphaproteobacteria bacterium]